MISEASKDGWRRCAAVGLLAVLACGLYVRVVPCTSATVAGIGFLWGLWSCASGLRVLVRGDLEAGLTASVGLALLLGYGLVALGQETRPGWFRETESRIVCVDSDSADWPRQVDGKGGCHSRSD